MTKQVMVVGSAGGVGLALTQQLLARRYRVIATVLNDDEAGVVKASAPGIAETLKLDLGDADAAKRTLLGRVDKLTAPLDVVAVCAAIAPFGPVETEPLPILRRTMEVNVVSAVAIFQATIESLRKSKGRLILISSMSGKLALPFLAFYTASKFALEGVADIMRAEVAGWGVDIVVVEPGGIRTGMVREQMRSVAERIEKLQEPERSNYIELYRGFQRLCAEGQKTSSEPTDVAAVLMQVLDAERPDTRYVAGADAQQFLDAAAKMSDRERDDFYRSIYGIPRLA
jgi:NAD(P)-dependent dehydrogenase (short-subunit alcohol dehydrogenase family)